MRKQRNSKYATRFRIFFVPVLYTNGGSLCQAFLAETVETETKNRGVIESHTCLVKIKFRDFPKRVVPELYRFIALITLERVNTTKKLEKQKEC